MTEAPSSPAGALQLARRRARLEAACQPGRACGAARRRGAHGTDSAHSSAADGGPTGGGAQAPRYADSRPRYRSAQDLVVIPLFSHDSQGAADGGAGHCHEDSALRADRCGPFGTRGLLWVPTSSEFFPYVEQTVDIPVPLLGFPGDLQGFHTGQGSTARPEQKVDIPVPRGCLQNFRPGQVTTASSSFSRSADEAFASIFRAFPQKEKVRSWVRTRSRGHIGRCSLSCVRDGLSLGMASSCTSRLRTLWSRSRACTNLYVGGAGKVWTVYELACFLRPPCARAETSSCLPFQLAVEVPQIQFFVVVGFQFLGMWVCIDKSLMSSGHAKAGSNWLREP